MDIQDNSQSLNPQPQDLPPHKLSKTRNYDKKIHGKHLGIPTRIAIMAMKDSGMTATEVAKKTKCHKSTIVRAWHNPELNELSPQIVQRVKDGLSGLFYKRALGATLAITEEKLSQSSALQLATVAGIMTEKGRLMSGESTSNLSHRSVIEHISNSVDKLDAQLRELE